ncbi:hypothetical protein BC628DRAFT_1324599 [Trametes gibbosa]|nr:hypothetical protein BC628DRAFT_1324599 [Trametes gibbosa]
MSFVPGSSRVHPPRNLHGSKPGLLDSSQPGRLLRVPGSTLSFSIFDPFTAASSPSNARKRYDPEPPRPKRIVVETQPGLRGPSRWRFVPRARRAPGVEDEGVFPRRVMIDGEPFILSEEQWDIYKLDPAYDCYIPQFPGDPVITHKSPEAQSQQSSSHTNLHRKRRPSTPPPNASVNGESTAEEPLSPGIHKKFRTVVNLVTDEEDSDEPLEETEDEDEVEEIVAEEFARGAANGSGGSRPNKERRKEDRRKEQREKLKAHPTSSSFGTQRSSTPEIVDLTMEDDTSPPAPSTEVPPSAPPNGTTKRRLYADGDRYEDISRPNKKPRTQETPSMFFRDVNMEPSRTFRTDMDKRRSEHKRSKMQERQEYANRMKEQREQRLWEEILADTPRATPQGSQSSSSAALSAQASNCLTGAGGESQGYTRANTETTTDPEPSEKDDADHLAAIAESRRKLAELEKDRPLWEKEEQRRTAQQRAEEEANRLRKEEERRRANAIAREEERQRQRAAAAAAETERRARAEKERIEREREQRRRRERERWSYGPWTTVRAIERYKTLSEAFDTSKFTPENPVMFEIIPWPVLHSPATLRVEDIEWSAVEDFFEAARNHMRGQDYKVFVEKSHKRFHPDRWRARGVLKSVADEETRGCLEVAANTVAQALTPIWRDVRG